MVIAPLALLVCIVGLVLYLLPFNNPKIIEIGRIMFFSGLLAIALSQGSHVLRIG